MAESKIIAKIEKNKSEEVVISLEQFRGHNLLDIRSYADFDNSGERRPTKKGITLRVSAIPELLEALNLAHAEAKSRGFIEPPAAEAQEP